MWYDSTINIKIKILLFTVCPLIKTEKKWLNAIKQDQLTWPNHVSELTGWKSTPGAKYGVSSIPKTFLIDKNGIIIDYDLRGSKH